MRELYRRITRRCFVTATSAGLVSLARGESSVQSPPNSDALAELIGPRYWTGSIAVDSGQIFLGNSNGQLRRGNITGRPVTTKVIGPRYWDNGSIAVANGFVFLARNGQLRKGRITSNTQSTVIGPRLWDGSIAVEGNTIYLARRGQLRSGQISDNVQTTVIGPRLWDGDIAVEGSTIYLARENGELRRGTIGNPTDTELIGFLPPNSKIAIENAVLYVTYDSKLFLRRLGATPRVEPVFDPSVDRQYPCYRIPSLGYLADDQIWAFGEGRTRGCPDPGRGAGNDLVLKRRDAYGGDWGPLEVIASGGRDSVSNPTLIVREGKSPFLVFNRFSHSGDITRTFVLDLETRALEDVTSVARQVGFYFAGPGLGLELQGRRYRGRLVVPMAESRRGGFHAYVIYRDPNTGWRRGNSVTGTPPPNENQIVELADGRLYMNSRSKKSEPRLIAYSSDGGESWTPFRSDGQLTENSHNGCHGSVIPFHNKFLIYSHPSHASRREDGKVYLSSDGGISWSHNRLLADGSFGYSALHQMPLGTVGCLFESGGQRISYTQFDFAWMTKRT